MAAALTLGLLWSMSTGIIKVTFTSTKMLCWRTSHIPC